MAWHLLVPFPPLLPPLTPAYVSSCLSLYLPSLHSVETCALASGGGGHRNRRSLAAESWGALDSMCSICEAGHPGSRAAGPSVGWQLPSLSCGPSEVCPSCHPSPASSLPLSKQKEQEWDSGDRLEASNLDQTPKSPGRVFLATFWLRGVLGCPGADRVALSVCPGHCTILALTAAVAPPAFPRLCIFSSDPEG